MYMFFIYSCYVAPFKGNVIVLSRGTQTKREAYIDILKTENPIVFLHFFA